MKPNNQRVILGAMIAISGALVARAGASPAPYGFGELKLGMTLTEADGLRSDDRIEPCGTEGDASQCLVRDDVAFSRKARIVAEIDPHSQRVSAILVEIRDFSKKKGYPCAYVADAVIKGVSDTYGKPECGYRRIGCTWHLPESGRIDSAIFCPTQDPSTGWVNIRFSQGEEPK